MYQYYFSSTIKVFFYKHNIFSQAFCSKWIFSQTIFFPDFSKIQGHGKGIFYFPGRVGTLYSDITNVI